MIILPWQRNKHIDNFATLLADEFFSQIRPDVASEHFSRKEAKTKKNNSKKVNQAVVAAISEVKKYRESQKLGVYGKARFHMKFMERLTELGYEQEVAKKLNEEILLKTS